MFIQLHLLTSYPPSNLNRDDTGQPKSAFMGGAPRLRVSSQALKRAWRVSPVFAKRLEGALSIRTRRLAAEAHAQLLAQGVEVKVADATARLLGEAVYGKVGDDFRAGQLAFVGPAERAALDALVAKVAETGKVPDKAEADAVVKEVPRGADIALFGRMLASTPRFNVEAAAEVAHALTVHRTEIEDDYFTAVDDLQTRAEDDESGAGAGFVGETGFGAGLFYHYICVDFDLLARNLGGDRDLAAAAVQALTEAATTIGPSGKRASFASRAYASYILAERGDAAPRSLSVAYLTPVKGDGMLGKAVTALEDTMTRMDRAYGAVAADRYRVDVSGGVGSLDGLLAFLGGEAGNLTPAAV